MNPVDDYLMAKTAIGRVGSDIAKGLAVSLGGAMLLGAGGPAAQKIWGAITRRGDFKEMMSVNPDLREVQQEDPRFFNHAYSSLRRVNPTFGRDPIVAGSYMKKMMANRDAAGLILAESVKAPEPGYPSGPIGIEMAYAPREAPFPIGLSAKGRT